MLLWLKLRNDQNRGRPAALAIKSAENETPFLERTPDVGCTPLSLARCNSAPQQVVNYLAAHAKSTGNLFMKPDYWGPDH